MRPWCYIKLTLAAVLTAAVLTAAPALAQSIDWYGECPEPGFGATCEDDDSGPRAGPSRAAAEYECGQTDLDSVQTEYHRAVGAFVRDSAEEHMLDAMLWLARVQNLEAHWDDWHYWCDDFQTRTLLQMTLEDDIAEQFAREYEKYYPRRPVEAADILGSAG